MASQDPPKTPAKPTGNTLFSTPGNMGSAGRSQDMESFNTDIVAPILSHDLNLSQTFRLDDFLIAKLEEIRKPGVVIGGNDLLDEAFQAVTRYANGEEGGTDIITMKENLREYCKKSHEGQKYGPFVLAANHGLKALQGCAEATFIPPDRNELAFARNDPRHVRGNHDNITDRKPDVINSSVTCIQRAHGIEPTDPPEVKDLFKLAHNTPKKAFEWFDIRSCWEFKNTRATNDLPTHRLDQTYEAHVRTYLAHETWNMNENQDSQEVASVSGSGVDSTASGTVKRKHMSDDGTGSRKTPRGSENSRPTSGEASRGVKGTRAVPAVVQVADYAAEAFNFSVARSFMLNFVVRGCTIHIWHFDHESPLQSEGFDFIKELPTFLLLLFILQRLPPTGWGFIPELDKKRIVFETSGGPMEFVLDEKNAMIHSHYGLSGRCTQVLKGTVGGQVAVMKVSHPEISRPPEQAVISVARKRCEYVGLDADDALKCLPEVLCSRDLEEFRTDCIRKKLLVKGKPNATRIPRAIVFPFYEPITSRTKDMPTFFIDYRKIMLAHALLWLLGVEHGDISEANLRFCTKTSWPILCDWDLSHFTGEPRPAGFSNTGTLIFMANDLLTDEGREGAVTRVYRHDAESLFLVLIWILARFRDGMLLQVRPLEFEVWKQQSWESIVARRTGALRKLEKDMARRAEIFSGIDELLQVNSWSLGRPFDMASADISFLKAKRRFTPEKEAELQETLKHYNSLDFIEEVFKEVFFDRSQEREKAFALLRDKSSFDAAIKGCPAPRSCHNLN
ncbi:other 1 protein kinase [Moniliophthora roreri MCA 2997]|uniref:Other 1 protein kinase n=1 Tax=Moniliophthora roreri (strain MCA 2997) TaxID=1381753 RepID=V2XU52_MONRO|nr:other 1 protein kinase [Moniliophthora roreri MCA 2997]